MYRVYNLSPPPPVKIQTKTVNRQTDDAICKAVN